MVNSIFVYILIILAFMLMIPMIPVVFVFCTKIIVELINDDIIPVIDDIRRKHGKER